MTTAERIRDWFHYAHQRGVLMHCTGTFWWCLVDNIAHEWFRLPLDQDLYDDDSDDYPDVPDHWGYWICRKHDRAAYRGCMRKEHSARARRIRQLGWGQ